MSDCYEGEEDVLVELMDYAHNGDNNPDQKEVDVIFEEACNDLIKGKL